MLALCTSVQYDSPRATPVGGAGPFAGVPVHSSAKDIQRLHQQFWSRYSVVSVIHDGGDQCRVYRVSSSDRKEYVAKIQIKSRIRGSTEAAFRIMMKRLLNIPGSSHLVQVNSCFEDDKYFYTLYESCHGGDLWEYFDTTLSRDCCTPMQINNAAREIVRGMLMSLSYLHEQGLVHNAEEIRGCVDRFRLPQEL